MLAAVLSLPSSPPFHALPLLLLKAVLRHLRQRVVVVLLLRQYVVVVPQLLAVVCKLLPRHRPLVVVQAQSYRRRVSLPLLVAVLHLLPLLPLLPLALAPPTNLLPVVVL